MCWHAQGFGADAANAEAVGPNNRMATNPRLSKKLSLILRLRNFFV